MGIRKNCLIAIPVSVYVGSIKWHFMGGRIVVQDYAYGMIPLTTGHTHFKGNVAANKGSASETV